MAMIRTVLLVGGILFLGLLPDSSAADFPLKTADNGRFLIDQKGNRSWSLGTPHGPSSLNSAKTTSTAILKTARSGASTRSS